MAYVPQEPPSQLDIARARLGDLGTPPILADWIYTTNLESGVPYNEALARLAESLGAYWLTTEGESATLGDQTIKTGGKSKYYFDLAKSLRDNIPSDGLDASLYGGAVGTLDEGCVGTIDFPNDSRCPPYCWPFRC